MLAVCLIEDEILQTWINIMSAKSLTFLIVAVMWMVYGRPQPLLSVSPLNVLTH